MGRLFIFLGRVPFRHGSPSEQGEKGPLVPISYA